MWVEGKSGIISQQREFAREKFFLNIPL